MEEETNIFDPDSQPKTLMSLSPKTSLKHERLDFEANDVRDDLLIRVSKVQHDVEVTEEPPQKRICLSPTPDSLELFGGDSSDSSALRNDFRENSQNDGEQFPIIYESSIHSLSPEASERMDTTHEFEIIDEVVADDDGKEEESELISDDSFEDSELYALLEEGITKDSISRPEKPTEREKVVLVELGHDPFDILPEGWLVVTHNSGMPLYLHRESRVCTLAQPYFLGSGSARKHDIPISAIPCLKYRQELEKETDQPNNVPVFAENTNTNAETDFVCPFQQESERDILASSPKLGHPSKNDIQIEQPSKNDVQTEDSSKNDVQTEDSLKNDVLTELPSKNDILTEQDCDIQLLDVTQMPSDTSQSVLSMQTQITMTDSTDDLASCGVSGPGLIHGFPSVKIKSANEVRKETSLDYLKIREYCQKLFQFKTVTVQRYKTWRDRRKHMEAKKQSRPELVGCTVKSNSYISIMIDGATDSSVKENEATICRCLQDGKPFNKFLGLWELNIVMQMPSSTKLITCSLPIAGSSQDKKKNKGKEFFLNPSGKSYVCILHEYVQHTMKVQPFYVFKELENSKTPYSATVMINDMEYGSGCAISKKLAKSEAAKNTLKILIPEMNTLTDDQLQKNAEDLSFFDEIKIEDPRISELGNKAGQPSPYQILRECLSRNYGMGNTDCVLDMKPLKHQNCEFTITVGKHKATVIAKSKRSGKQRAAQAILQKLHPHVPSWGSLLRLYGSSSDRGQNAKKKEVNEVKSHRPNQAILDRLREEMKRLHAQKEAIKSRGKMVVHSAELPSRVSSVDL